LQVTTRNSQITQRKRGELEGIHVAYLTKRDSVSAFLPLPMLTPPADVSKPAAENPVPKTAEAPAAALPVAALNDAVELAATHSSLPIDPAAIAVDTSGAPGRTWEIPGLSFGPNNWSIVRITNPSLIPAIRED
jgi:hypothetical protein